MPFFSIIIPVYNAEPTIEAAIHSVLHQTFADLEIIVVDGFSKDKTIETVKKMALDDSRIQWVSEKDNGVYDAMNKGIAMARGEWLYFLGSDDFLFADTVLEKVRHSMEKNRGVNFVYGNVSSSYLGENYDGPFDQMKIAEKNICHQAIFYKKEVFEILGNYKLKYKVNSDWEFNIRCFFSPAIKTQYFGLTVAYFSGGGLSNTTKDSAFSEDRNYMIVENGYPFLPLKKLKFFCKSNAEFGRFLIKRMIYFIRNK